MPHVHATSYYNMLYNSLLEKINLLLIHQSISFFSKLEGAFVTMAIFCSYLYLIKISVDGEYIN